MDTFLGRALTDPATGLPNVPYFTMIQNWEERRAQRRRTLVRVLRLHVTAGGDARRRGLMVSLCQELRNSDLIASEGKGEFWILLTSPDAENAEAIAERIEQIGTTLNAGASDNGEALALTVDIEAPRFPASDKGPCDPCEEHELIRASQMSSVQREK